MSHVVCSRCQRANPGEAVFCWFDGVVLRQSAVPAGSSPFLPQVFVFPSGRSCRTFDDLLAGCQDEWEAARDLLRRGDFGRYLARLGRMDLVRAAQEAQAQGDPDLALQNFLSSLPAAQTHAGPRLDLSPRRLMLGSMRAGEQRQVRVTVSNKGKGVLQGKVRVSEGAEWLKIVPSSVGARSGDRASTDGDGGRELPIKTTRDQDVTLRVEPRGLPAGQTYSAKLTVVTNGGVAEAPVRLDLAATPFPRPPFQGASAARELAERMRANPKPAGPLLESGDVARWFAANGWSYPVAGTPARGVAAVQQFFECMGLSKPPPLELSQNEFTFRCEAAETVRGQVTLRTPARKWVYAQASSDRPWLRVTTPNVSGPQQTAIFFEVDSAQMGDGPVQEGVLHITANAGQRFPVRVRVEGIPMRQPSASGGRKPPDAVRKSGGLRPPLAETSPTPFAFEPETAPIPARPTGTSYGGRLVRAVVVGALLAFLLRMVLLLPADLYARVLTGAMRGPAAGAAPTAGWDFWRLGPVTEAAGERPSVIAPGFLRQFIFATWWVGVVAALVLVRRAGGRPADLACAAVAGAAAGVVGAATLACLLVLFDGVARLPLSLANAIAGPSLAPLSPWVATPLWMVLAVACWTVLGAAAGLLLGALGPRGGRILSAAAAPLAWALRSCGMGGVASVFSLQ